MSTPDPTVEPGRTNTGSKPYRSGIARTLGRRAMPRPVPPVAMETPQQSPPQAFAVAQPPQRLPANGGGDTTTIRRSQTQMAAIFARAVAQGQRNL
jgi:hypothetical protein